MALEAALPQAAADNTVSLLAGNVTALLVVNAQVRPVPITLTIMPVHNAHFFLYKCACFAHSPPLITVSSRT